jgi:hypothetical protein
VAQHEPDPATILKQVSRLELTLIQKNLRYLTRTVGADKLNEREQRRLDLVKATSHTESELASIAPTALLYANAARLTARLRELQQDEYKRVNDLSVYIENSVVARRAYFTAAGDAMQHGAALLDSLDAVRLELADQHNIKPDLNHQIELWKRASHRITQLYRAQAAVTGIYFEEEDYIKYAFQALMARDAGAFEKARRQLLEASQTALNGLKTGNDLDEEDITLRQAGQDFVLAQEAAARNSLASIGQLLKRLDQLSPDELKALNTLINDYQAMVQEGEKTFQKAVNTFLTRNSPNMDSY